MTELGVIECEDLPDTGEELEALVDHHRRHQVGRAIVEGYRDHPQTAQELAGLDGATRSLVEEEPW